MKNKEFLYKQIMSCNQNTIGQIYGFNYSSIAYKNILIDTFKEASKSSNPLVFLQDRFKK